MFFEKVNLLSWNDEIYFQKWDFLKCWTREKESKKSIYQN